MAWITVPMKNRAQFFGDPFFADCWSIVSPGYPQKLFDQKFATDIKEDQISPMFRPSRHFTLIPNYGGQNMPEEFQVMMDVAQFAPDELSVKTVDNCVVVEGNHEEKQDPHGLISRQFTRKYNLPEDVKPETVECYLSSDGVLVIKAKRPRPLSPAEIVYPNEHIIPITKEYNSYSLPQTTQIATAAPVALAPVTVYPFYQRQGQVQKNRPREHKIEIALPTIAAA